MSLDRQPELINRSQAEAELTDCLLTSPTLDYPWDPTEPATADYYTESDSYFSLDDWSDNEVAQRSQSFFTQIQACWLDTPSPELEFSPAQLLTDKFGHRVPHQWLAAIATKVSTLANSQLEPVEQLVQSVQDLLANWAADDLLVMARPYAYAMRCDPGVSDPDRIVRPLAWTELTELERAKLTILIAQYAIDTIEDPSLKL
jgi:hypothetical protein